VPSLGHYLQPRFHLLWRSHSDEITASNGDQGFSRLAGKVYADYAGCPPYAETLVRSVTTDLLSEIYGNPHSEAGWPAGASTAAMDRLRFATLAMCEANPEEYCCILTSGATAALKLLAHTFPWSHESVFVHLNDNHTSVLGMREVAASRGATTATLSPSAIVDVLNEQGDGVDTEFAGSKESREENGNRNTRNRSNNDACHLFAFPLESNFAGVRYSERLSSAVQNGKLHIESHGIKYHDICAGNANAALPQTLHSTHPSSGGVHRDHHQQCDGHLPPGHWLVVLDAAKACGTRPPNLSRHPADFVALSYYKIFGMPTGLGALLVRRDALAILQRNYFGGGTVSSVLADERTHVLRPSAAGFEDGTLPFLSIPAALRGFEELSARGGFHAVESAGMSAARRLALYLRGLRHANGMPVVRLYGLWTASETEMETRGNDTAPTSSEYSTPQEEQRDPSIVTSTIYAGQGPVVTFNVLSSDGDWIGHRVVERIASLEGIFLRSGVMCNPGACRESLEVSVEEMKSWYVEHKRVCWDDRDLINGKPTGAVRVSFGYASKLHDADIIAECIARHFRVSNQPNENQEVDGAPSFTADSRNGVGDETQYHVQRLYVYPVKSCAAFRVTTSWPLGPHGLLFDRQWAVVDMEGRPLTLRRCPALARIAPAIDLKTNVLKLYAKNCKNDITVPLPQVYGTRHALGRPDDVLDPGNSGLCLDKSTCVEVCGRGVHSSGCANSLVRASAWLSNVLELPCRLEQVVLDGGTARHSFANDAALLLVNSVSLHRLQRLSKKTQESQETFASRFRPNIVISPSSSTACSMPAMRHDVSCQQSGDTATKAHIMDPYPEEMWGHVRIGGVTLEVQGPCPRCDVICMDPSSGLRCGSEPLLALANDRRRTGSRGRLCFGVLANAATGSHGGDTSLESAVSSLGTLKIGQAVETFMKK
jgi:molybdenum cofactor sulfurtransferase